jgi:signal transduction histidine kinase
MTLTLAGDPLVAAMVATGAPARLETADGESYRASLAAPVSLRGALWGLVTASTSRRGALPPGAEQRLADFGALVAQSLENAQAQEEIAASRARVVEASDAARRRLERDLHDGAQQRLVSLALTLRMAEAKVAEPAVTSELLRLAREQLTAGLNELQELARGIHPALLTKRGLRPALESLAGRAPLPVDVEGAQERLPERVEVATYYVVAEALTNAAKHARASRARVSVQTIDGAVRIEVADDGAGGADESGGSGLRGLADRVESLGGTFSVASPRGGGTLIRVRLPLG